MSEEQADTAAAAEDAAEEALEEEDDERGEGVTDTAGETGDADEEAPDGTGAGEGADADEETTETDALVERVADAEPAKIAEEIVSLRDRVEDLEGRLEETESERDDLESRLKRKQAEFQNYKKRQEKRRENEQARATEDLVERLLEVRDNLRRAVDAEADADIRDGVEATFRQLDDVFEAEGVETIEPEPGDEVDPQRHEVLLRVESDRPEGTIAELHRPGYEMGGKVLRAAQVTVSE